MNRDELVKLAEVGMRQRLLGVERQLAQAFRDFPGLFIGETPPQFVKPELKNGNTSDWPIMVTPGTEEARAINAHRARWTPERRAAQAELMRARRGKHSLHGKHKRQIGLVHQVHRYLAKHGESALKDIMKATGAKASSSVISSMHPGLRSGRFSKPGPGRYALGPNAKEAE
jgi:hypothetical protein